MGRDTWLLRYLGAIVMALSLAAPAFASERARALSDAVLDQMEAGEFQAVHDGLSPEMQATVSVQTLAQGWTGLQQQFGPLGSRGEPRLVDRGGTTLVVTPLHFQRGTLSANLAFDDQERTISLLLQPAPAAAAAPPAADAGFHIGQIHAGPDLDVVQTVDAHVGQIFQNGIDIAAGVEQNPAAGVFPGLDLSA